MKTMKKITKSDIETLANKIIAFLETHNIAGDVSIYFNNKVLRSKMVVDGTDKYKYVWNEESDVDPHTYFDYAAYDHILSMSFEGALYDVLNYRGGILEEQFEDIFEQYGLYTERGNSWNLSAYLINDDTEVEYTYYNRPKKTIHLYRGNYSTPSELEKIMDIWYDLSKKEGDKGSCVLGAGFNFEWQGEKYFMTAQSPWQGSLSWEAHKDVIQKMLENVGATNIRYDWGRMD